MELYLLKSAACLTILYAFYKLFLERESMHTLKRFYLLGIVVISFTIPFITFTEYVEVTPITTAIMTTEFTPVIMVEESAPNYWAMALWSVYIGGVLLFGGRLLKNLWGMVQKIRTNPRYKDKNIFKVLLQNPTTPHTFLSYIFLNKDAFESNKIPKEVLDHEEVHAREWHSLDVLFLELLLVVFWFNPLLHLIRHSIKLNHEFLADRAVLKTGIDATTYQNTLLAFSSSACSPSLANSINYSFIKKRIKVMKKRTSNTGTWVRSLIVIPLLAILVYGFSTTEIVEKPNPLPEGNETTLNTFFETEDLNIRIDPSKEIWVNERPTSLERLPETLKGINAHLSKEERQKTVIANITGSESIPIELVFEVKDILVNYGIKRLNVHGKVSKEGVPGTYAEDLVLNFANDAKSNTQQKDKATKKEVKEYNKLAKKYNDMSKDNMFIVKKEVARLKYLYAKMTEEQRANSEPFPNFPPPPPPPPSADAPGPPEPPKGKNGWVPDPSETPPPPPPAPDNVWVSDPNNNIPPPPPPPEPEHPVDHIKTMAKKGATFYYEGNKISSDRAISLLKQNESLNIQTTGYDSDSPVVQISKEPINHFIRKKAPKKGDKGPKVSMDHEVKLNPEAKPKHKIKTNVSLKQQDPLIDLRKVISEGATFYFNDQKISVEKAKELVNNPDAIATVNVVKGNDGKPKVYFWSQEKARKVKTTKTTFGPLQDPAQFIDQYMKEGATFFLGNKQISGEEAKKRIRNSNNNDNFQIDVRQNENGQQEVHLIGC